MCVVSLAWCTHTRARVVRCVGSLYTFFFFQAHLLLDIILKLKFFFISFGMIFLKELNRASGRQNLALVDTNEKATTPCFPVPVLDFPPVCCVLSTSVRPAGAKKHAISAKNKAGLKSETKRQRAEKREREDDIIIRLLRDERE